MGAKAEYIKVVKKRLLDRGGNVSVGSGGADAGTGSSPGDVGNAPGSSQGGGPGGGGDVGQMIGDALGLNGEVPDPTANNSMRREEWKRQWAKKHALKVNAAGEGGQLSTPWGMFRVGAPAAARAARHLAAHPSRLSQPAQVQKIAQAKATSGGATTGEKGWQRRANVGEEVIKQGGTPTARQAAALGTRAEHDNYSAYRDALYSSKHPGRFEADRARLAALNPTNLDDPYQKLIADHYAAIQRGDPPPKKPKGYVWYQG